MGQCEARGVIGRAAGAAVYAGAVMTAAVCYWCYSPRTGELREGGAEGEADEEEAARRLARCGERDHLGEPLRHAPLPHGVAALAGASIPERVVMVEHPRMHLPW